MKAGRFAIWLCAGALLVTGYLGWAFHRVDVIAFVSERHSWPYPDDWLVRWERYLDAAHPAPPGAVKLEGEIDRVRFYLVVWIVVSASIALGSFAWLMAKKRKRVA